MRQWLTEKYMSPEVVNELISMMGQSVLRKLLCHIKRVTPHWFGIIADEATDVSNREQLNLSIRWVNDNYEVYQCTALDIVLTFAYRMWVGKSLH